VRKKRKGETQDENKRVRNHHHVTLCLQSMENNAESMGNECEIFPPSKTTTTTIRKYMRILLLLLLLLSRQMYRIRIRLMDNVNGTGLN